jgi:phosphoribosylamine--glycine ligase
MTTANGNEAPAWGVRLDSRRLLTGIPEEVHIEDVMQVNGQWYVAGTSGVVLVVCGLGQTMRQAQAQAYSRIRNIMIPDMYYRDDIGERWFEDHDKLHTWGYLREV